MQIDSPITYTIAVETANVRGASTDADVHIALMGDRGTTGRLALRHAAGQPSEWLQRGRTDIFTEEAADVGALEQAVIGHNNTGAGQPGLSVMGGAGLADFASALGLRHAARTLRSAPHAG